MPPAVAKPLLLKDPGFLWAFPLGSAEPSNTVAGSKFTDAVPATYIPLGATEAGTTFAYSSTVEAINAAEFLDPIEYATTGRAGSIAFALLNWTLSNYRRALNGGLAAIAPTSGTGATALGELEPPEPGAEVRAGILWESTDASLRLLLRQTLQGGEVSSAFGKAPAVATIPCTYNLETPAGAAKPWKMWSAGAGRLGV